MPNKTCPQWGGKERVKLINDLCYCYDILKGDSYCDLWCPIPGGCYCNDINFGGDRCDGPLCRMDHVYCMKENPIFCTKNIDLTRQDEIKECPCVHGRREGSGRCKCYENYGGFFCDQYRAPQPTLSTQSTTPMPSSDTGSWGNILIAALIGGLVGLALLYTLCYYYVRHRYRRPGRAGAYSGPPIPTTKPLMPPAQTTQPYFPPGPGTQPPFQQVPQPQTTQPYYPSAQFAPKNIGGKVPAPYPLTSQYGMAQSAPTDNATQCASTQLTEKSGGPQLPTYDEPSPSKTALEKTG